MFISAFLFFFVFYTRLLTLLYYLNIGQNTYSGLHGIIKVMQELECTTFKYDIINKKLTFLMKNAYLPCPLKYLHVLC